MIKNLLRGLPALALAALPLLTTAPSAHAVPTASSAEPVALPLFAAIDQLPVADEQREGYQRSPYKHWTRGIEPHGWL
ncbi:hypothetical protein AB0I84_36845 [Streptomyces spectabilis]|uniref:hypothetical protein n=1 Tax=Streptomyces spectabilis TaxID=68270 RepID=UPI0033C559B2